MKAKLVKHESGFILYDEDNITIGAEPNVLSSDVFSKLSLKNCQAIERGYDLDELADNYGFRVPYDGTKDFYDLDAIKHYKAGFQKALELMGDKKFSASQLLNAMDLVWQWINGEDYGCKTLTEVQDKHIQSLQQTEWEVIYNLEELDADGCLILKLKSE